MSTDIMNMYCNENYYMPEYFRVELSQFMSLTRRAIVEKIQKSGENYEVGNSPLLFIIYRIT